MTNVFILAAGSSTRFNGEIKQLLPVNKEPIIRRTIRLIKEYDPDIVIYVLTWKDPLKFSDVKVIDTKIKPLQLSDTMLISVPYWGERNVFLLGDVVFEEGDIKNILTYTENPSMFYKYSCSIKPNLERFAFVFDGPYSDIVIELLKKSSRIFENTTHLPCCGFLKICYATRDERLIPFISPVIYTDGSHPYIKFIRPFRDFIVYHVWQSWEPRKIIKVIPLAEGFTTDIDTPEEYKNFLDSGAL